MKRTLTVGLVVPLAVVGLWIIASLPTRSLAGASNKALAKALGDEPPQLLSSGKRVTCTARNGRTPQTAATFNHVCSELDYGFLCAPGTGDQRWTLYVMVTGSNYAVVEENSPGEFQRMRLLWLTGIPTSEAEGEGFEPSTGRKPPVTVFETAAFNHSATPPGAHKARTVYRSRPAATP